MQLVSHNLGSEYFVHVIRHWLFYSTIGSDADVVQYVCGAQYSLLL